MWLLRSALLLMPNMLDRRAQGSSNEPSAERSRFLPRVSDSTNTLHCPGSSANSDGELSPDHHNLQEEGEFFLAGLPWETSERERSDVLDAFSSSQSGLDEPLLLARGEIGTPEPLLLFICSTVRISRPKSIIPGGLTSSPFLSDGERGVGLPIFKSVAILGAGGAW